MDSKVRLCGHTCRLERREMRGTGKTVEVCPECEREKAEALRQLFGKPITYREAAGFSTDPS